MGLVTQQAAMANGTLARNRMAISAAGIIWKGISIIEKNKPMARPLATVSRQGIHKARLAMGRVIAFHHGRWRRCGCRRDLSDCRTSLR